MQLLLTFSLACVVFDMSLWVDRHKPKRFEDLDYHLDQAEYLKRLVERNDFPHILINGPLGAGKKTRLGCILKGLYGTHAEKLKLETLTFQVPSGKKVDINIVSSSYHIELNPSDVGVYDRHIIQDIIKQSAQTVQLDSTSNKKFKVIVITEADRLTKDAQHALRRTMEKYSASCRIILMSETLSPIIDPIQSRCLCVRVPSPSQSEMIKVMEKVCYKENIELNYKLAERIYNLSEKNVRRALLMLETCRLAHYPFSDNQEVELPHWQVFVRSIANEIFHSQTPEKLMEIRTKFYELLTKCIPVDIIFKELLLSVLPFCDSPMKNHVVQITALYENRSRRGSKAIFHLEAYVAHLMAIYKRFIDEGIAELF